MVVHERAQSIDIFESSILFLVAVADIVHGLTTSKDILDSEVHWVVEQSSHVVLVIRNIAYVSIEAFTHLEYSCSLAIFGPEWLLDVWDSIDTDSIEIKLGDNSVDPCLEVGADVIVGLIKVW